MSSSRKRIRAHANPLSEVDNYVPLTPDHVNWQQHYPNFHLTTTTDTTSTTQTHATTAAADIADNNGTSNGSTADTQLHPTIADIGCGFGGLTVALATALPTQLIVALEIRDRVVDIVKQRFDKLRADSKTGEYQNISVVNVNVMKHLTHYFAPHTMHKLFFCFPDPHFKRSNYRRRIINASFLDYYAYVMVVGGLLYTITDVKDLHEWMTEHCSAHPLFERVSEDELAGDVCYKLIHNHTEEGQKVERIHGSKYPAVYRRIQPKH